MQMSMKGKSFKFEQSQYDFTFLNAGIDYNTVCALGHNVFPDFYVRSRRRKRDQHYPASCQNLMSQMHWFMVFM